MIINIKEDSIKVITDEGREKVYIKNEEEVIEEQESLDLTEENNSEEQKENLIGKLVERILPFLFCSALALGSLFFLNNTALPKFLEDINKTDYLESREDLLSSVEEFKNSTNYLESRKDSLENMTLFQKAVVGNLENHFESIKSYKEMTPLEKNTIYFYNLFAIFLALSFIVSIFIISFTHAMKEIERAIKWATYEVKRKKEGL